MIYVLIAITKTILRCYVNLARIMTVKNVLPMGPAQSVITSRIIDS